jgi:hypothetical protein
MSTSKIEKYPMEDEVRIALLEQSIGHITNILERLDNRFNHMESKLSKLDDRILKQSDKIDSHFKWIISTIMLTVILPSLPGLMKLI